MMCSRVYPQPWQALGLPDQSPWVMQGRGMARALVLALRGLPQLVARRTWQGKIDQLHSSGQACPSP
jgi:hypothetical protein